MPFSCRMDVHRSTGEVLTHPEKDRKAMEVAVFLNEKFGES